MYILDIPYSNIGIPNNARIIGAYICACSGNSPAYVARFYNASETNIRVGFLRNNSVTYTLCVCYLIE